MSPKWVPDTKIDMARERRSLVVCILLFVLDQVQGLPSNATDSIVVYYSSQLTT
jgi:hypothetical protein